jgi:phosphohistidine phosphatase
VLDLLLIRHAIAADRDPADWPDDSLRPLTPEGIERFRRAARGLARLVPEVDEMLASPYARAWETAWLLHEEAGWPKPQPSEALEAIRSARDALPLLDGREGALALVGHEPNLSSLASLLLSGDPGRVPLEVKKGGAIHLAVEHGHAVLRWHATPKLLRLLDR